MRRQPTIEGNMKTTNIGERLKALRESAGLTKYQLAQRAGVDAALLGRIENGKATNPSWEMIQRLADALEVSTEDMRTTRKNISEKSVKDS